MRVIKHVQKIVLGIILICSNHLASSQAFFEATTYVSQGSVMSVVGDYINRGNLVVDGSFLLDANWDNTQGIIQPGVAGRIILHNEGARDLRFGDDIIERLVITGGGEKRIVAGSVEVNDEVFFQMGHIVPTEPGRFQLDRDVSIRDASDDSHVDGAVYYSGTKDSISFPTGTNGELLPIRLFGSNDPGQIVGFEAILQTNIATFDESQLWSVSDSHLWEMLLDNGSLQDIAVEIAIDNERFLKNIQDAVVAGSNETRSGTYQSLGQGILNITVRTARLGTVRSVPGPSFQYYTLGELFDNDVTIQNVMTPNFDGRNDFLMVENIEKFPNNTVTVLNQWGQEVFTRKGYANLWDGTQNGAPLPNGTYTCIVTYRNGDNELTKKVGYVSIIN